MSLLALDVGGTKLAAGVAADGGWTARITADTPASGDDALAVLLRLADEIVTERVKGIGVSFGGHVDAATGTVRRSIHVPGWEDVPLAHLLSDRFGAPASIANDANAGALGEWEARGLRRGTLCYVTVSTGVGGGVVVDGEILEGADGLAGEVGHLTVLPDGEICSCGRRGCVETLASGPAIARRAEAATAEEAGKRGDGRSLRAFADAAHALAVATSTLIGIVNPATIVIGGGVARAGPLLWEPLEAELACTIWPQVTTRVCPPATDDPALAGALVLAARAAR